VFVIAAEEQAAVALRDVQVEIEHRGVADAQIRLVVIDQFKFEAVGFRR